MNADECGFSSFDIGHSLFGIRYSRLVNLEMGKLLPLLACTPETIGAYIESIGTGPEI